MMGRCPVPDVPELERAPRKPNRIQWSAQVPGMDCTYDDLLRKYWPQVRVEVLAGVLADKAGFKSVSDDALYKRRRTLKARGEW